ncbi:ArnT family glycosyltransferase [Streptomyces sp. NPDC059740]|uniref:ArnT family glycosyltransferase n=1 Tax=Streptomyces sp. NPDC059740 TaxID=3346926 RepID=UPI0036541694
MSSYPSDTSAPPPAVPPPPPGEPASAAHQPGAVAAPGAGSVPGAVPPVPVRRYEPRPGLGGLPERVWRGRPEDPRWARPALLALLAVTAVLYLWDLGASGYANQFYSAAAQAGGESWKAFFFGSSDAANSITVDKPAGALWPMGLSVRIFGLSSWAILVPQALMGVAAVGLLYGTVRRRFGAGAALLSGVCFALTPVAALMFRFNNPDAMLCLLMVGAVACVARAMEDARTRWLVGAGVCFGVAFLAKTLQAWLILPVLALVYLCCAPTRLRRRIGQLLLAGLAVVVSAGWWVALVELWPAGSRPYIGGSQNNDFLELTFGYNGFGRITGNESGSVGGGGGPGGGGGGGWGETGITRLFSADMGGQIAWLLPAAFLLLVAGVVVLWRARRATAPLESAQRAELLAWGGSLLMTFTVFSFMSGIFHQYYNIALAPYVSAVVGTGATVLWRRRAHFAVSAVLAVAVVGTAVWSFVLLGRSPQWLPWLRWTVLVAGIVAALGLVAAVRLGRRAAYGAALLGALAALAGPVAYTLNTVNTPHTGSIITAGPSVSAGFGGFPGGGRRGGGFPGGPPGATGGKNAAGAQAPGGGGFPGGGQAPGGGQGAAGGQAPGGGQGGQGAAGGQAPGGGQGAAGGTGRQGRAGGFPGGFPGMAEAGRRGGAGGMGGLLNGTKVSAAAKKKLLQNADDYTWVAAAIGSQNSAGYQLATQKPVMPVGGFNGTDPSPTLAQFKKYVERGRIHYFLGDGRSDSGGESQGRGGPGGGFGQSGSSSAISTWVAKNYTKVTVGSTTMYDLTKPVSGK